MTRAHPPSGTNPPTASPNAILPRQPNMAPPLGGFLVGSMMGLCRVCCHGARLPAPYGWVIKGALGSFLSKCAAAVSLFLVGVYSPTTSRAIRAGDEREGLGNVLRSCEDEGSGGRRCAHRAECLAAASCGLRPASPSTYLGALGVARPSSPASPARTARSAGPLPSGSTRAGTVGLLFSQRAPHIPSPVFSWPGILRASVFRRCPFFCEWGDPAARPSTRCRSPKRYRTRQPGGTVP